MLNTYKSLVSDPKAIVPMGSPCLDRMLASVSIMVILKVVAMDALKPVGPAAGGARLASKELGPATGSSTVAFKSSGPAAGIGVGGGGVAAASAYMGSGELAYLKLPTSEFLKELGRPTKATLPGCESIISISFTTF